LDLENRAGFVDARPEGKRDVGPTPGVDIRRRQTEFHPFKIQKLRFSFVNWTRRADRASSLIMADNGSNEWMICDKFTNTIINGAKPKITHEPRRSFSMP
jgi:hypothetical protein